MHGDFLEIGGYEEEAAEKVTAFLQEKLPEAEFQRIAGYLLQVEHDETYCTWDYFLSVQHT